MEGGAETPHRAAYESEKSQMKDLHRRIFDSEKELDKIMQLLKAEKNREYRRTKWAWFSVVGKISRFLFGNLDEADEEELKQPIENNNDKTRQIAGVVSNQTEVIYIEFEATHARVAELQKITDSLTNVIEGQGKQI